MKQQRQRHKRRIKLTKPRLQLKLIGIFVGLSAVGFLLQSLVVGFRLSEAASDIPEGGDHLMALLPGLPLEILVFSFGMLLPLTIATGVLAGGYLDKCTEVVVMTSGVGENVLWMGVFGRRVDAERVLPAGGRPKVIDLDPLIIAFDTSTGDPLTSGVIRFHESFGGRTMSVPGYEFDTIQGTVQNLRNRVVERTEALGAEPPERVEIPESGPFGLMQQRRRWVQEITDKEDVIAWLRESFDYALEAIPTITGLDTEAAPFGFEATKRAYLLILQSHAHEHLGQSIAYARSIGVVPPWSQQPQQALSASVAEFRDGGAYGAVMGVDELFGNLGTNLVATDLEALGIQLGGSFVLRHEESTVHVLWGESWADVRPEEWVAFISREGTLLVGRNLASAAQALECEVGDEVFIRAPEPPQ